MSFFDWSQTENPVLYSSHFFFTNFNNTDTANVTDSNTASQVPDIDSFSEAELDLTYMKVEEISDTSPISSSPPSPSLSGGNSPQHSATASSSKRNNIFERFHPGFQASLMEAVLATPLSCATVVPKLELHPQSDDTVQLPANAATSITTSTPTTTTTISTASTGIAPIPAPLVPGQMGQMPQHTTSAYGRVQPRGRGRPSTRNMPCPLGAGAVLESLLDAATAAAASSSPPSSSSSSSLSSLRAARIQSSINSKNARSAKLPKVQGQKRTKGDRKQIIAACQAIGFNHGIKPVNCTGFIADKNNRCCQSCQDHPPSIDSNCCVLIDSTVGKGTKPHGEHWEVYTLPNGVKLKGRRVLCDKKNKDNYRFEMVTFASQTDRDIGSGILRGAGFRVMPVPFQDKFQLTFSRESHRLCWTEPEDEEDDA